MESGFEKDQKSTSSNMPEVYWRKQVLGAYVVMTEFQGYVFVESFEIQKYKKIQNFRIINLHLFRG